MLGILQQGTIGVSRPKGKLPGIPFMTLCEGHAKGSQYLSSIGLGHHQPAW